MNRESAFAVALKDFMLMFLKWVLGGVALMIFGFLLMYLLLLVLPFGPFAKGLVLTISVLWGMGLCFGCYFFYRFLGKSILELMFSWRNSIRP